MARIIVKFRYIKRGETRHLGNYVRYIATREGVEKITDSDFARPVTQRQEDLIAQILRDFPETEKTREYRDYQAAPSRGAASAVIDRAIDDHVQEIEKVESYTEAAMDARMPPAELPAGAATEKQRELIAQLLQDFPDIRESLEYEDYEKDPTMANASRLISRALEDHYDMLDGRSAYVSYIATRPGAERDGSHGLFTSEDVPLELGKTAEEVSTHDGNVYTAVISLRREDAQRLGYDNADAWKKLMRSKTDALAQAMRLPSGLRWYAAFHNEGYHPHIHMVIYSTGREPYLDRGSIREFKSELAKTIFREDLIPVYAEQTRSREAAGQAYKDELRETVERIQSGERRNPELEARLLELAKYLKTRSGKMVYGYLPAAGRKLVDQVVDELEKDPGLSRLYDQWYAQRDKITEIYHKDPEERIPLSQNKEFKFVRNAAIREALRICAGDIDLVEPEEATGEDPTVTEPAAEPESTGIPEEAPPEVPREDPGEDLTVEPVPGNAVRNNGEYLPADPAVPGSASGNRTNWWTENYKLARKYLYGTKDQPPDLEKAYGLMLSEAKAGNGLAMHDLGKMLLSGLGCERDEALAQSWFLQAHDAFLQMEETDKRPHYWQYRLGKLYSYGYGVEQDYTVSAEWFAKAVEGGSPFAAYALGGQYYRGQGVEQDYARAFSLFTMAATDASKPNAYAQYQLGQMCEKGIGTAVDHAAAEKWYRQAYQGFLKIEQTMADDKLYYRLGSMNLNGTGTEVDLMKAKVYFEKAAALENVDALYGLGKLYLRKEFTDYDPAKAAAYLERAAGQGHTYAQYALGKLLLRGEEIPRDTGAAIRYLSMAAEAGNDAAMYQLGKLYYFGCGKDVARDYDAAIRYLTQARDAGNQPAAEMLERIQNSSRMNASMGALRLIGSLSRFMAAPRTNDRDRRAVVDRKEAREIAKKKRALGVKQ